MKDKLLIGLRFWNVVPGSVSWVEGWSFSTGSEIERFTILVITGRRTLRELISRCDGTGSRAHDFFAMEFMRSGIWLSLRGSNFVIENSVLTASDWETCCGVTRGENMFSYIGGMFNPRRLEEKIVTRSLEGGQSDPFPLLLSTQFIRMTWNLVHITSFICSFN